MSWLNSIKYIIMNKKYSWSDKVPSSFSGIPIKVHPSVLLNYNISWLMINIFFWSSSYRSRLPYFARNMDFDTCLLFLICNFYHSSIYNFNSLVIASSWLWNNFSTPHWSNWYSMAWYSSFQEWLCGPSLLFVWDRALRILASSIKADIYTILCFSKMSLPGTDLFPDFIV